MSKDDKPTPDPYTNEWYREQFQKMQYHWNRSMGEEAELAHQVNMLRKEVKALADQRAQDMAKIGELQERMDKASQAVADIKKRVKETVA